MFRIFLWLSCLIASANMLAVQPSNTLFDNVLTKSKSAINASSDFIFGRGSLNLEDQELVEKIAKKLGIESNICIRDMSFLEKFWFGAKNEGFVFGNTIYVSKDLLNHLNYDEKEYYFAAALLRLKYRAGISVGFCSAGIDLTGYGVSKRISKYSPQKITVLDEEYKNKEKDNTAFPQFVFDSFLTHINAYETKNKIKKLSSISISSGGKLQEEYSVVNAPPSAQEFATKFSLLFSSKQLLNWQHNIWDKFEYYITSQIILDIDKKAVIEAGCKSEAGISVLNKIRNLDLGYSFFEKHLLDSNSIIVIILKDISLGLAVDALLLKANNLIFGSDKNQTIKKISKILIDSYLSNTRTFRFYLKDRIRQLESLKIQS